MPWMRKKGKKASHYIDHESWEETVNYHYSICGVLLAGSTPMKPGKLKCKNCLLFMGKDIKSYTEEIEDLVKYKEELEDALKE